MGSNQLTNLSAMMELQKIMSDMKQVDTPVEHFFGDGVYARKMFIPKDTVVVGKMHKHENINIMLSGDITVVDTFENKRISEPCIFVAPAKVKRAVYAHEDTVWVCFHATKSKDLDEIESEVIEPCEDDTILLDEIEKIRGSL